MSPFPDQGTFFWVNNCEVARAWDAAYRAVNAVEFGWFFIRSIPYFKMGQPPIPSCLEPIRFHFFNIYGHRSEYQFQAAIVKMQEIEKMNWYAWVVNTMRPRM